MSAISWFCRNEIKPLRNEKRKKNLYSSPLYFLTPDLYEYTVLSTSVTAARHSTGLATSYSFFPLFSPLLQSPIPHRKIPNQSHATFYLSVELELSFVHLVYQSKPKINQILRAKTDFFLPGLAATLRLNIFPFY